MPFFPIQTSLFPQFFCLLSISIQSSINPWEWYVSRHENHKNQPFNFWPNYSDLKHDLTPNGGLVREIPLFQGILGWWNIIIWPDGWYGIGFLSFTSQLRGTEVLQSVADEASNANHGSHLAVAVVIAMGGRTTKGKLIRSMSEFSAGLVGTRVGHRHQVDWPLQWLLQSRKKSIYKA